MNRATILLQVEIIFIALMINYLACLIATELVFNFTISDLGLGIFTNILFIHVYVWAICYDGVFPAVVVLLPLYFAYDYCHWIF